MKGYWLTPAQIVQLWLQTNALCITYLFIYLLRERCSNVYFSLWWWCCQSKCLLSRFMTCSVAGVQDLPVPEHLAHLRSSQAVPCFLVCWLQPRQRAALPGAPQLLLLHVMRLFTLISCQHMMC